LASEEGKNMSFLNNLFEDKNKEEGFPEETIKEITKLIKEGAKNRKRDWANALELIHAAFKHLNVPRPNPNDDYRWKQYEELIQVAVKELRKSRYVKGDWRMSSTVFKEGIQLFMEKGGKHQVLEIEGTKDINRFLDTIAEALEEDGYTMNLKEGSNDGTLVEFERFGIKNNLKVWLPTSYV
jgi:hypothetical protein